MMRVILFVLLAVLSVWALAERLEARTLIETRFSNVRVLIYQRETDGSTRVQITADVENGVTPPRRIQVDVTDQLNAGQLSTASSAYTFILGKLGARENVPTPTPTNTP